jgi:hypothetical protein
MHPRWRKPHVVPAALLVCFWLFVTPTLSPATQTMLIVSNSYVVIAADSLFTGEVVEKGCKIRQSGTFFWTAEGLINSTDGRFDIDNIISRVAKRQRSTSDVLDQAGLQIVPALQREIPSLKRKAPSFYGRAKDSGIILKLAAAHATAIGVEGYVKEFTIGGDDRISARPAQSCGDLGVCRIYTSLEIKQYVRMHPDVWNADIVWAVNLLLGLAIDADPQGSARPISILRVAPNDTRWLQQNGCPDISTPPTEKTPQKAATRK